MVFKSFATIARHSAIAKNLFVASTSTSAQPAFFVSTQQLARQQATAQAQQLVTRGFYQSFSSGSSGGTAGSAPSLNGAAFPSYGSSTNAIALSITTSSNPDDEQRFYTDLQKSDRLSVSGKVSPVVSTFILDSKPPHVLRLSASGTTSESLKADDLALAVNEKHTIHIDPEWVDSNEILDSERFVEVDDETAANIIAAGLQSSQPVIQQNHSQLQLYRRPFVHAPISQSELQSPTGLNSHEFMQDPYANAHEVPLLTSPHDIAINPIASEQAIDALFAVGDHAAVIYLYELMKACKTVPTLASFNNILISLSTHRQLAETAESVNLLLGAYAHMLSCQIVPDVMTYSTVILALVNRYMDTRQLNKQNYQSISDRHDVTVPAFTKMQQALKEDPSLKIALDIFSASVSVRLQNYPIEVYNALLEACAEAQYIDGTLAVLAILDPADSAKRESAKYDSDTYISLIRSFSHIKRADSVTDVFESYKQSASSLADAKEMEVYAELIRAYFRCDESTLALAFFEQAFGLSSFKTDPSSSFLCDAVIEGMLLSEDYTAAWKWMDICFQESVSRPSNFAIAALLSAASRKHDLEKAVEIFDYLSKSYGVSELWMNSLSDYMVLCMSDMSGPGLARFVGILESIIASGVKCDAHMARDAALYLIEHPFSSDDTILQAFLFVQYVSTRATRCVEDTEIHGQVLKDSLLQIMSHVKWSLVTNSALILSRVLAALSMDGYKFLSSMNDETSSSLLCMIFTLYWSNFARGVIPAFNDLDSLVYLHAKFAVEESTKGELMSEFLANALNGLSNLLVITADQNVQLSEPANYFVTLAAPIMNSYFSATARQTPSNAMATVRQSESLTAQVPEFSLSETPSAQNLDASEEASKEVSRQIVDEVPPGDIINFVRESYRVGKAISLPIVQKFITYAGDCGAVEEAESMYSLVTNGLASNDSSPSMYFVWSSLMETMLAMYLRIGGTEKLVYKEKLVAFKQRLIAMGAAPCASTYANLILKLKLAGSHDEASEAVALFKESKEFGIRPSTYLYNALLSKLSKARRLKDALFYFDEMAEIGVKITSVTYGTMISASCRAGDEASAELLFRDMERAPEYKPRIAPFNTMLQFYVTYKKDRESALRYFRKMRESRLAPSSHSYKLLIDAYAMLEPRDFEAARNVLKMIADDRQTVTTQHYASLISAEGCVRKDMDSALRLFNEVVHSSVIVPDEVLFQALIESYIANDLVEETDKVIADMRSKYNIRLTPYVANTLIRGWEAIDIKRSRKVFNDVYSRNKVEPSTFEVMTRAYLKVGDAVQAREILNMMMVRGYPDVLVSRVQDMLESCRPGPSQNISSLND
ncbi:hypothetical protein V1512DRAFT_265115 [Lipomyces arxii]|uniref:uncharacterized protein n=1 Tax=Lipomyces arxii TaxID=56418 RepID=UPI0034CD2A2A